MTDRSVRIDARPLVMGIINVTPDSFSDGGRYFSAEAAVERGLELAGQGADILDIGGESSRPGAVNVPVKEELSRVLPVVQQIARKTRTLLSIDTTKSEVAQACLDAGAHIINDITGLTGDRGMVEIVRQRAAGLVIMHMRGTPQTMQQAPHYGDVVAEIGAFLEKRLQELMNAGIPPERVVLDPGIGFGKTRDHNIEILAQLGEFQRLGRPICLGVSRKGFLGKILDRPVEKRLASSLAVAGYVAAFGTAQILRVHDVEETCDLVKVLAAIRSNVSRPAKS
jgi:dihydropteroate synthase